MRTILPAQNAGAMGALRAAISCVTVRAATLRARGGLLAIIALATGMIVGTADAQQLRANPNLNLAGIGRVEAMVVQTDGKIVIGGAFSYVTQAGDARTNLARFNPDGTLDTSFDFRATSTVDALAIVGTTLYVGGDFASIVKVGSGASLRNRLAAIDLNTLSVTAFNPNVDGEVFALASNGATLYAGGAFTSVGGTQRFGAAAFDTTSGNLTAWAPGLVEAISATQFPGVAYSIAAFNNIIYVGGRFTHVAGGLVRLAVAAFDTDGAATLWDPVASNGGGTSVVRAIVPTASVVYLGGQFSALNNPGYTRVGIGAVSTSTGLLTAWNPGNTPPNGGGTVRTLALDGSTMFVGGEFTGIGGAARNKAGGVDTTTVAITSLTQSAGTATAQVAATAGLTTGAFITIAGASPVAYNDVHQITVTDGTHFTFAVPMATTSPATGTIAFAKNSNATSFSPNLDGDVHAVVVSGANVVLGGLFLHAGGLSNPAFGGFAKATGARTISGYVFDVATVRSLVRQSDGKTIVGGDFFLDAGGVIYRGLLRLKSDDTLDTGWNPYVNGQVISMALGPALDNSVLVAGVFNSVGNTARKDLAAINLTSAIAIAGFDANVNGPVDKVVVDGSTAYIGGVFTSVGATNRFHVAAINPSTGALQAWYPTNGTDDFVQAIAVDGSSVFLGGAFTTAGGLPRLNAAKVSKATSVVDPAWNPAPDEVVYGLSVVGSTVYVAGNFKNLAGTARNYAGAVAAGNGVITGWNPNPDFVAISVVPAPTPANTLYLSGAFLNVNGTPTGGAAAVDATTGALKPWYPLTNDTVNDVLPDTSRVLLGGLFITANATPRFALAGFSIAGVPDPPTGAAAIAGNTSASVSFSAPLNNGGSAITGYTATCTPAVGSPVALSGPSSPINVTGLTNGVSYTCTVHATNSLGSGGESLPTASFTPATGPPVTLTVTVGGSGTGSVGSSPAGIACPGDCTESYGTGTGVTLTATPAGGMAFTGWLGACTGTGTCNVSMSTAKSVSATFAPSSVLPLRIDIDGNSTYDALTDGLLIIRYLFGLSGPPLTNGALGGGATLMDPTAVAAHLNDIKPALDVDGNGQVDALTDGLILIRYLFGLRDAALIAGAIGTNPTRGTAPLIQAYIVSIMP